MFTLGTRKNTKCGWEIWLEGHVKKLRQQANVLYKEKIHKDMLGLKDKKKKTADKSDNTDCRKIFKKFWWKNEVLKDTETGSNNTSKQNKTLQNNEGKFYQRVDGECQKVYHQPDAKETK